VNHPIAIIADDLTGALDSAVAFSALGSSVTLFPLGENHSTSDEGSYAVAVSTASRAMTAAEAHNRAREATAERSNADTLFVKVDSTLRGQPAAHLDGVLEARRTWVPRAFAVICPALPIMGRTMHGGEVLDHLLPITHSAAATDPLASAASATITDIFAGSTYLEPATIAAAGGLTAALVKHDRDAQPGIPSNICVDASTDAELDALAEALAAFESTTANSAVAVGSAGLAGAIARRALLSRSAIPDAPDSIPGKAVMSTPSTLIFMTSLHPAARKQLAVLQAVRAEVTVHVDESTLATTAPTDQRLVVVTTTDREPSTLKVDEALAATIANQSALLAATLLRTGNFDSLLIVGGDGASALLRELGADSIRISGEILAGVPVGFLRGGEAHGITIATRSGGFGHDQHLNDILTELHQQTPQPQPQPQPQPKDHA